MSSISFLYKVPVYVRRPGIGTNGRLSLEEGQSVLSRRVFASTMRCIAPDFKPAIPSNGDGNLRLSDKLSNIHPEVAKRGRASPGIKLGARVFLAEILSCAGIEAEANNGIDAGALLGTILTDLLVNRPTVRNNLFQEISDSDISGLFSSLNAAQRSALVRQLNAVGLRKLLGVIKDEGGFRGFVDGLLTKERRLFFQALGHDDRIVFLGAEPPEIPGFLRTFVSQRYNGGLEIIAWLGKRYPDYYQNSVVPYLRNADY